MALIGIGIDLVDIARAGEMLSRWGDRVLRRLLTPGEQAIVLASGRPEERLATRLAAKEAVYKAMQALPGARAIAWRDIEVVSDVEGRPTITLHGLAATLAHDVRGMHLHVSLSHSEQTAGAVVVVEGQWSREGAGQ